MDKLYLVTRSDLPLGVRASQLVHAQRQFAAEHPDADRRWFDTSNTLVLLEVPGERELEELERRARIAGTALATFREPDFGHQLTSLALGPEGKRHVRALPKAFSL